MIIQYDVCTMYTIFIEQTNSVYISINIVHSLCAHGTHIQDRDILIKCVKDKKWLNFMLCISIYIDYNGKHLNQNKKKERKKKKRKKATLTTKQSMTMNST